MSDDTITPKWAEGLTHRERRFVEEYLVDLNRTNAMRRVGKANQFDEKDHDSPKSAHAAAYQMLRKPRVARAIEIALNEVGVTRVWIINELAKLARADLSQFVRVEGGSVVVKNFDEIDPELLPLLSEVCQEHDKDGNPTGIRIKLMNDRPALRYLAKLLRMEVERTEISGPNGGPIETVDPLARIQERLNKLAEKGVE